MDQSKEQIERQMKKMKATYKTYGNNIKCSNLSIIGFWKGKREKDKKWALKKLQLKASQI